MLRWIGKDLKGSGRRLIWNTFLVLGWDTWRNQRGSLCLNRDTNRTPPRYLYTALSLCNFARFLRTRVGIDNVTKPADTNIINIPMNCLSVHLTAQMREGKWRGAVVITKKRAVCVCLCNDSVINERTAKLAEQTQKSIWSRYLRAQLENAAIRGTLLYFYIKFRSEGQKGPGHYTKPGTS
jgi:hypothetical protein